MMEAVNTSETSVSFYETTRHKIQKTVIFRRRKNLKSEIFFLQICS
jgi:hypothetical protein